MGGAKARPSFGVGGRDYTWGDVVLAAKDRGDWRQVEQAVREGVACLSVGDVLSRDDVHRAAVDFRRARRLSAAEELEQWLQAWDLTTGDWTQYLRRSLLRQQHRADLSELVARFPADVEEVDRLSWPTAVCSGALFTFARQLAARLAVQAALAEEGGVPPEGLDEAYEQFRVAVANPAAVDREVFRRELDWTRVEYRTLAFPREPMAREAILWLTDDGRSLDEVAAATDASVVPRVTYLEDAPETLRAALIGAVEGAVYGPVAVDGTFQLVLVGGRHPPSRDDVDVRRKAEEDILRRAVERQVDERVRWHGAD